MNEQAFAQQYSTQEKLLLAQAVYKLGAAKWEGISELLTEHPCMVDKSPQDLAGLFSPKACEEGYVGLMTDIGINVPAEGGIKPHAKAHLRLAQTFYFARMTELKASIATYEQRFATLMSEIQMIKTGEVDGAIAAELRAVLVKKFGKKLLDACIPEAGEVAAAAESGEVTQAERAEREEKTAMEKAETQKAVDDQVEAVAARERNEREAAEEEDGRIAVEAEAGLMAQAEAKAEIDAEAAAEVKRGKKPKSGLVQYSSPPQSPVPQLAIAPALDDLPEETSPTKPAVPNDELLLPPIPRRKKGGRSQKGASMEAPAVETPGKVEGQDAAEGPVDAEANSEPLQPAAEGDSKPAEGRKRPKRGSLTTENTLPTPIDTSPDSPTVANAGSVPTSSSGRPSRRGKTPAQPVGAAAEGDVEMADNNTDDVKPAPTPISAKGRPPRKAKTQTPAPEPKSESAPAALEGGDVNMAEPDESTIEALTAVEEGAADAEAVAEAGVEAEPTRESRRKSTKPEIASPAATASRSNKRQSTPPSNRPLDTKASSASPLTSDPDSDTLADAPAATKSKSKGKGKQAAVKAPKRNSKGGEEEEKPVQEEPLLPPRRGGNKRKAAVQPTEAPAGKRKNTKRGAASPAPTVVTVPDSEMDVEADDAEAVDEAEEEKDGEEEVKEETAGASSRRKSKSSMPAPLLSASSSAPSRRGRQAKESPGLSAPTKAESPGTSRRAMSVTSTASAAATPAVVKRGRGRPPAKPKAVIVKEAEPEEESVEDERAAEDEGEEEVADVEEPEVEEKAGRNRVRNRGVEVEVAVNAGADQSSTSTKRANSRKSKMDDNVEVDMSATPTTKRSHTRKASEIAPAEPKRSHAKKARVEVEVDEPASVTETKRGRKGKAEQQEQVVEAGPSGRPKRESAAARAATRPSLALGPDGSEPPASTAGSLSLSPRKERDRATPAISDGAPTTASRPSLGAGGGSRRRRNDETSEERDKKMNAKLLMGLLDTVSAHKNGNVFQNPVKINDAPDYFEIVKQPMDLKTMRLKIRDGNISTLDEFERDLHLIFANAMMYNEDESQVYAMAQEMLKDAEGHLAHFRLMQQDLGR